MPKAPAPPTEAALRILVQNRQFNFSRAFDESYVENLIRIQTPQGLAAIGTISLPWKPDTELLTIHKLNIIRNGRLIDVLASGQTFTVLRRENNLEYSVLDGILTATIQPSGLEVNDVVDIAYSIRRTEPILAGNSEWVIKDWPTLPIAHLSVQAKWESPVSIRWQAGGGLLQAAEKLNNNPKRFRLELDNVNPLEPPRGAPARFLRARRIEFSEFKTWTEVADRLAPLYEHAAVLPAQSELHQQINGIKARSSDPTSRMISALALVQDKVRYVYIGMNEGNLMPASADLTWARRFGDCKAKAALLISLLHALDIAAEPVAVSTVDGDGLNTHLPMIELFDHVIVRAVVDGKTYWLDGTRSGDDNAARLNVPFFHWGLPLATGGSELVKMEPGPLTRPLLATSILIDATAGAQDPARFHIESRFAGDAAIVLKTQLGNLTPSAMDEMLRSGWSKGYAFVNIQSVSAMFDATSGEERFIMDGTAPITWADNRYAPPGIDLGFDPDFKRLPCPDSAAPFAVPYPFFAQVKETILLPKSNHAFAVEGGDIERTVGGIEFKRHSTLDNSRLNVEVGSRSIASEFPYEEAAEAETAIRAILNDKLYVRVSPSEETAAAHIDKGDRLLGRHDYAGAIVEFDQAIALDPRADMAFAYRGMAHGGKGENAQARSDFDAAFAINQFNTVVYRGRGILLLREGHASEAALEFTMALSIRPQDKLLLEARAQAFAVEGEKESALADAATVIHLDRSVMAMYSLRASVFRQQGENLDAADEAERVVTANPESAKAYEASAAIYRSLGQIPEAIRMLQRANELAPKDDSARLRAKLEFEQGHYAAAVSALTAAITERRDDPALLTERGIAYAKNDQEALAKVDFADARSHLKIPDDLNTLCWRMATARASLDMALAICEDAVTASPSAAHFLDSRGFVLLRMGRFEEAIASYDRALAINNVLAESLYGRGLAKRLKGNISDGDSDIKSATALDADIADTFAQYGLTL